MKVEMTLLARYAMCALAVVGPHAVATTAWGQVPPAAMAAAASKTTGDYRDFLFLASDRPVLLRLHIQSSGKPYYVPFDNYMDKLFAYLDLNNDGVLDAKEAQRVPNAQWLQFNLQGNFGFPMQKVPLAQLDMDKNGKVSRKELSDYYRRFGFNPLRVSFNANEAVAATAVTTSFFNELDTNKDGKLSPAEVALAPTALERFDLDDDEMLTQDEIAPGRYGMNNRGGVVPRARPLDNAAGPDWLEIDPKTNSKTLVQKLLAHYDKNKDRKLDQRECGLDAATFAALDVNHDGKLDAVELARFFERPAGVELVLHTGKMPGTNIVTTLVAYLPGNLSALQPRRVALFNPAKRPMPMAAAARANTDGTLAFKFGDTTIALDASEGQTIYFIGNYFRQQFQASANKEGFLDRKTAQGMFAFTEVFDLCDRDGDGKLYRKELDAFLDLQTLGSGCLATLSVTDEGRNLFTLFDADGDNRLSIRELRTGWTRLEPLAARGQGLARNDIPRRLSVVLDPNNGRFVGRRTGMARNGGSSGPVWFRKMDRNNDGDVSVREFLGTPEQFRRFDTDGDGLISPAEARRAETKR
jgi:Ca2+-binding EF-hand superfamily protein